MQIWPIPVLLVLLLCVVVQGFTLDRVNDDLEAMTRERDLARNMLAVKAEYPALRRLCR